MANGHHVFRGEDYGNSGMASQQLMPPTLPLPIEEQPMQKRLIIQQRVVLHAQPAIQPSKDTRYAEKNV